MEMTNRQLDIPVWSSGESFRLESEVYMMFKILQTGKSPRKSREIKWLRK